MKKNDMYNTTVVENFTADGGSFLTAIFTDEDSPFYGEYLFGVDGSGELIPEGEIGNAVNVIATVEYTNYAQYWAKTHRIGA